MCAILSSSEDIQGCKGQSYFALESKGLYPSYKLWKKEDLDIVPDVKCQNVGDCGVPAKSIELLNDYKKQQEVKNADKSTETSCVTSGNSGLSDAQIKDPVSSSQDKTWVVPPIVPVQDLIEMVPTQQHLFWRNELNFCWLDTLLVALVHTRTLREACENVCLTDKIPSKSHIVKNLCATYMKSHAYIKAKEQQCQGK